MKAYPLFEQRKIIDLDGIWDFTFLGDVDIESTKPEEIEYNDKLCVPSAFDAMPKYANKRGLAVYRTYVDIIPGKAGQIYFQSVGMWCRIFIDGEAQLDHHPAYTAFSCDIPKSEKSYREIVVYVDNRYNLERSPLQENFFDFYNYGGIFRSVTAYELPDCFIQYCHITRTNAEKGEVTIKVKLNGMVPDKVDLTLEFDEGKTETCSDCVVEDGGVTIKTTVPNPKLWDPENPNLHILKVSIADDAIISRFGLREIKTDGKKILINGESVKLLGFCRHEAHPQFGPVQSEAQMLADIHLLQDMGCNFVRGSHYPQDQRFLDLCDEMGLLFFEESMGWGQNAVDHFTKQNFVEGQLQQTEEMIMTSFNHPSVIMWGFLNEGESSQEESRNCYESLIKLIRKLDPSRLVTYASNRCGNDIFLDQIDVISFNIYPGWYGDLDEENPLGKILPRINNDLKFLKERNLGDKPFILSEIGAGAIYGWRDPHQNHWSEQYQSDLLSIVCNEVVKNEEITGISVWQFCDCRTYSTPRALGRPRSFNNKGVVDEYRRQKMAYQTVKKIFTK